MRLEFSSIQDMNIGVQHIHSHLASLHLKLQSLKKGKESQLEVRAKVWCLKCKGHEHDKDHRHVYQNYLIVGGPIPMKPKIIVGPSIGEASWYAICQVTG